MKKPSIKSIVTFAVILAGLLLFELLTVATIDVTMNIDTRQSGDLTAYYARAGEGLSDEKSTSFEIPNDYMVDSYEVRFKIAEDSSILRIDMEDGLEELTTGGVLISYGIIPLVELTAQDMPAVVSNNIFIEGAQDSVEIIAIGTDPNFTVNIGLTARLVLFAVKFIIYAAAACLASIIVLNIRNITKSKIFVLVIAAMLTLPAVSYYLLGLQPDASLENETLAKRPTFSLTTIADYPRDYDEYYNDYIPYKPQLVELNSFYNYYLYNKSPNEGVLVGKDGWAFLADTLPDYQKTELFSQQELGQITETFLAVDAYLSERDIEFYITVPPNKSTIYGEYLPQGYIVKGEQSKVEQVVEHITQSTDITFIYDAQAIEQYSKDYTLYYKMDSHWNGMGGYIGFKTLAEGLGFEGIPAFEDMTFTEHSDTPNDLYRSIGLDIIPDEKNYLADFMPQVEAVKTFDNYTEQPNIRHYESNSANDERLLMFRDSYNIEMEPHIAKLYSESYFVWKYFDMYYVWEYEPDVVVFEVVERMLDQFLMVGDDF